MMFWFVPEDKKGQTPFIPSVKKQANKQKLWLARVYTKTRRENLLYHFDFYNVNLLTLISAFSL